MRGLGSTENNFTWYVKYLFRRIFPAELIDAFDFYFTFYCASLLYYHQLWQSSLFPEAKYANGTDWRSF